MGSITIREVLKSIVTCWLFLTALLIEFVPHNFGVLSDNGLGQAITITVCMYIPLFILHLWVLNRRKRNSLKKTNLGPPPPRTSNLKP